MKVVVTSGKKKTAIARAVLKEGKGRVRVNRKPLELVEPELARLKLMEPLIIAGERAKKVDIRVDVKGGGVMGQAFAARTAIARGMVKFFEDPELENLYKKIDKTFLVNDTRMVEKKHQLGRGARKKRQKSYR